MSIHPEPSSSRKPSSMPQGLSSEEAKRRLEQYGPNEVVEKRKHPALIFLGKFWAPVPWMLEAAIILTGIQGRTLDAIIISFLLVLNATVSFIQERRASGALELLKKRLAINARVNRDGNWRVIPARELVPGDLVHIRLGDIVPADLSISEGQVTLDQSSITGESLPVEAGSGAKAYSGTIVVRGEASGTAMATGSHTFSGKTAELVQEAQPASHLQATIMGIVSYLIAFDVVLVILLLGYALEAHISLSDALPFALILLIASVPAALPAAFTIATALGALQLARRGILVTRLNAIEEAAALDVACLDKTGTITQNKLRVVSPKSYAPFTPEKVLQLAAYASDAASQDPIDLAILASSADRNIPIDLDARVSFTPFDPSTKRTEATIRENGRLLRIIKGAPQIVLKQSTGFDPSIVDNDIKAFTERGLRILAIAVGPVDEGKKDVKLALAGILPLEDSPREDSVSLIERLKGLGIYVKMLTGDSAPIALQIASEVGIGNRACSPKVGEKAPERVFSGCDVFAGVYPQDKFLVVKALQQDGHITAMTGDGVNDAPALRQAEVGIAVAGATDVAKAAASLVLTDPGIIDIVGAVTTSRQIYQRMLTYTLNKIIKTIQVALFLTLAFFLTNQFIITPFQVVLLIFSNDFPTMAIATDNARAAPNPQRWHVRALIGAALALSSIMLVESFVVLWLGLSFFNLALPQLQTLIFVMLVFTGHLTIFVIRERNHFWTSWPSAWLIIALLLTMLIVSVIAYFGILIPAIGLREIIVLLIVGVVFMFPMDYLKRHVFHLFGV